MFLGGVHVNPKPWYKGKLFDTRTAHLLQVQEETFALGALALSSQSSRLRFWGFPNPRTNIYMSYGLNFLKGAIWGILLGTVIGSVKGDTRSLDYSSHRAQMSTSGAMDGRLPGFPYFCWVLFVKEVFSS